MRIEVEISKDATIYEIDKLMTELSHDKRVRAVSLRHHSTVLPIPCDTSKQTITEVT
jgi:hypothetical protein